MNVNGTLLVCVCGLGLALATPARAATGFELTELEHGLRQITASGHTVTVRADGTIAIDATSHVLVPPEYKARVIRSSHEIAGTTLTLVVETEHPTTRHDKPVWDLGGAVIAKIDVATQRIVWRSRVSNFDRDRTWNIIPTADRLFIRDRHGLVAIDRATGADAWRLDHDSLRSILVPKIYDTMKLAGDTLAVTGHYWDGEQRTDFAIELDAATGLRVYKSQRYVAPTPQPLYTRPDFFLEYPGDRAPPVQPTAWDGLRIGYAFLAWSKVTGEGIIVNPTNNDARTIIELAKRQTYRDASGKTQRVHWLAVYATRDAIKRSAVESEYVVLPRYKKTLGEGDQIRLEQQGEIVDSGEMIDAPSVATALGAQMIDRGLETPLSTKAGPVLAYHPQNIACIGGCPDDALKLVLMWGPYTFQDDYQESYRHAPL